MSPKTTEYCVIRHDYIISDVLENPITLYQTVATSKDYNIQDIL